MDRCTLSLRDAIDFTNLHFEQRALVWDRGTSQHKQHNVAVLRELHFLAAKPMLSIALPIQLHEANEGSVCSTLDQPCDQAEEGTGASMQL